MSINTKQSIHRRRSSIHFSNFFNFSMNIAHLDFRRLLTSLTVADALFIFNTSAAFFAALIGLFSDDGAFSDKYYIRNINGKCTSFHYRVTKLC